uniref:ATP-dependent DNA helicase n=1 Tax=Lactuca sativa TaxID=4236 RepID=A0A9R1VI85_LACSA|nr:hypothetical protein LSAT_V11C500274400 [Lactuca sativa]
MQKKYELPKPKDIDRVICVELPDKELELELYRIVCDNMIHGPCGNEFQLCHENILKDFQKTIQIIHILTTMVIRFTEDTTMELIYVVPYNKILLKQYQAHMNLEWCNQLGSIKIKKQHKENNNCDEIVDSYNCRHISACEARWRLSGYDIHYRTHPVEKLLFHLEDKQPIVFKSSQSVTNVVSKPTIVASQFLAWMKCNKYDEKSRKLSYVEFPSQYVWNKFDKVWTRRKTKTKINHVSPKSAEVYYVRILLKKVKGPTCYEDIRTVKETIYESYKDSCYALGLLDDDREYISSIHETHYWATASFCRSLLFMLITSDSLSRPHHVFKQTYNCLSDDVVHNRLKLKPDAIFHLTLLYIEKYLLSCGLSLKQISNMSLPDHKYIQDSCNMLIQDELNYDMSGLEVEHQQLHSKLNVEQKKVYDKTINVVNNKKGGFFFLYGYGGIERTFVWKTLSSGIRSKGEIVINVASRGVAALLLSGGRTSHSRFHIPINLNEDLVCSITQGNDIDELLNKAGLIIWDEAPMMHHHCFEVVDRTLRDVIFSSDKNKPFGGKTIIILVIQRGNLSHIVHASLHSSRSWRECTILRLDVNMRLQVSCPNNYFEETNSFVEWILKIGEGTISGPNDGEVEIQFPKDVIVPSMGDHIHSIVPTIYSSF